MKFYVWCTGDRSVGIPGQEATVEMEVEKENVADVKEMLKSAFGDIFDEKCHVMTDEEMEAEEALAQRMENFDPNK